MDVVVCSMLLHHVHDVGHVIREAHRVLRSGGVLVIREHDCNPQDYAVVIDVIHVITPISPSF
jgi:ubiquinone/menaquinone biosynthesis C-methylase UbiE